MRHKPASWQDFWQGLASRFLPFADAASVEFPMARLLRLALFQVSVGMAAVLLNGTLNRVLIVELQAPTWIVALLIGIPLLAAPFRALVGYKSDRHRSVLGWRRVPYIWFGTMSQFGGLAIMPFALLLLSRADTFALGIAGATLAFLMTGIGMHVGQTAGLALATDLALEDKRPRVVALLYVMLLAGMMLSAFVIGPLLMDFRPTKLVQIIQGAAALTMILNVLALWKQEPRRARIAHSAEPDLPFSAVWRDFTAQPFARRLLTAVFLGAMGFAMQDALLEPYGGEVLGLSVGSTTALTGSWAFGALLAFGYSGRRMTLGSDPLRLAGMGAVAGIVAFLMILFAAPLTSSPLLYAGAMGVGFGNGLFSVGTMIAAMGLSSRDADGRDNTGLALGAWGAVQASGAGLGIALGGVVRDAISNLALQDALGSILAQRATGYASVYLAEIVMLLIGVIVLGPIIGQTQRRGLQQATGPQTAGQHHFGLREFPT
jgi:MFS transporter, BCD family, chlorophyll transporter